MNNQQQRTSRERMGLRIGMTRLAAGVLALGATLSVLPIASAGAAQSHAAHVVKAEVSASSSCPQVANVADPPNIDRFGVSTVDNLEWWFRVVGLVCYNGTSAWETSALKCTAGFNNVPGTNYRGATINVGYCAVTYNHTAKLWQNINACIYLPPKWIDPTIPYAYHFVIWGRYYFTATGQTTNPILETHMTGMTQGPCPAGTA
jgi:hypothetical protein